MPLDDSASAKSICVFGDSHIGSVKFALDAGLMPEIESRVRFWGAPGPSFRGLRLYQGRVVPDKGVRATVARIAGDGPVTLGPSDFDTIVVYGARLRVGDFIKQMYDYEVKTGPVSLSVRRAAVRRWMESVRAYRFAQAFAAAGAELVFVPVSLPTSGVIPPARERALYHVPRDATLVDETLALVTEHGREDGVPLVFQPDDTVTPETMTRSDYATQNATELRDVVHKSPDFAALMMQTALDRLAA